MYTDSLEMKIFLVYHLLLSIRGDFSEDSALEERKDLALKLTRLAAQEFRERADFVKEDPSESVYYGNYRKNERLAKELDKLAEVIEEFIPYSTDGRYLRYDFPEGYHGMLEHFGLKEEE